MNKHFVGMTGTAAACANIPAADLAALKEQSWAARWGLRAMMVAETGLTGVLLFKPVLVLLAMVAVSVVNAVAQGPIITPSSGQFGNTIVRIIQLAFALIFIGGFVFLVRAIYSYFQKDGFAYDLIGAGLCWGINIVAYLVYALSKGQTVEIDASALGGN